MPGKQGQKNVTNGLGTRPQEWSYRWARNEVVDTHRLVSPTPEHATQTVHLFLEVDDLLDLVVNKLPLSCHQLLTFCGRLVEES